MMLEMNNSEKCQVLNSKMLVSQVFGRTCRLIPTKRTEGEFQKSKTLRVTLFIYENIHAEHEHVISVSIRNTAQYTSPLFVKRSLYAGLRTTIFHIRLIHKKILKTLVRSPHVIHLSIYPNHRLHNGLREILRIVHCKLHCI